MPALRSQKHLGQQGVFGASLSVSLRPPQSDEDLLVHDRSPCQIILAWAIVSKYPYPTSRNLNINLDYLSLYLISLES